MSKEKEREDWKSAELGVCFHDREIEVRFKDKVEREGMQSADRGVQGRATENAGMSTVTDPQRHLRFRSSILEVVTTWIEKSM